MIDISDGLSSDLYQLCRESNVGATIEASRIPVDAAASHLCRNQPLQALDLALDGGEDFELLFTVRPRELGRLPQRIDGVPITYIGDVTNQPGRVEIIIGSRVVAFEPGGFRHF
jgi:thiamine-monophosphate kinase